MMKREATRSFRVEERNKGDCLSVFPIESVNDEIRALSPPVVKFRCSYFTHNDANLLSQSPLKRLDPSSRGTERIASLQYFILVENMKREGPPECLTRAAYFVLTDSFFLSPPPFSFESPR